MGIGLRILTRRKGINPAESCSHGHPFTEANTRLNKIGRACRTCERVRESMRRKRVASNPQARAKRQEYDRLRGQERRYLEADGDLAHKNDEKKTAPWNALKPKEAAMPAWNNFQDAMAEQRTACYLEPEKFMDWADPEGVEDDPEELNRSPIPSRNQALAMCADCPLFDLCKEYQSKQKETHGVWHGVRYVNGKNWDEQERRRARA